MAENRPRDKIWGHKLRFGVAEHRDGLWAGCDLPLSMGQCVFSAGTPHMTLIEVHVEQHVAGPDPVLGRGICQTSVLGARCSQLAPQGGSLTPLTTIQHVTTIQCITTIQHVTTMTTPPPHCSPGVRGRTFDHHSTDAAQLQPNRKSSPESNAWVPPGS